MPMNRRQILAGLSAGPVLATLSRAAVARETSSAVVPQPPTPQTSLPALSRQLQAVPRRRQFTTLPRLLDHPDLWDDVAFEALRAYRSDERMIGTGTSLSGNWPVEAQNLLNSEIFSFGHPEALLVMALWSEAQLALYDDEAWSRYGLSRLTSSGQSVLPLRQVTTGYSRHHQDEQGVYGAAGRSIPALQARGVVFLACHNAVWAHAGRLLALGAVAGNPGQEQLVATLTNHLDPRAIVTPSALGALAELQRAGFSRVF
ncbi:hypothetical protein [Asaia bogorensis]|uniref:Transcriptional initiation protein Tat n=1 Tax=Asaia bogorensis NBRC 16594 TaxID=1231624 RepID=A0AAN4R201_9PROT|nr:hypothetical protein [Asaia bogorensis]BAT19172.1 hypothetical protein Asbog_00878 [Asaia bogorensis NBRC 16594]GBQ72958.1 hypothetical protein AA0311_0069 [Asaia bogorensis NBRC 16594]GEL53526.1 hypothetical protein ABO01nite_15330 [Asaia bogorensis NBRC 16594]